MLQPGEIYDIWFTFQPPILPGQPPGKYRPALILSVSTDGTATAVALKITGTGPTPRYPLRVKVIDWVKAGLDKESYAQIDSDIPVKITGSDVYRGTLEPHDFGRILVRYNRYQARIRHRGTTT